MPKSSSPKSASHPSREMQLAPGVYFTPAPNKNPGPSSTSADHRTVDDMSLEELRRERDALVKSVEMLQSSNKEMKEFDPDQEDPELLQAIGENIAIILRRRARAAKLEERIRELSPGTTCEETVQSTEGGPSENGDAGIFL